MKVLDLFSGIGGFSLGLERAGMTTVAFCERDPYCREVLAKHWPCVPCHDDVTTREFQEGEADVICGGFPCQDISVAGAGAGLSGERSGLYRELVRAIRLVRPKYAILENVAALLSRGMGTVLGDLAEIGNDAEWHCIPASAVGAPHRRDRVWIVANPADAIRREIAGGMGDSEGGESSQTCGGRLRQGDGCSRDDGPTAGRPPLSNAICELIRNEPRRLGGTSGANQTVARDDGTEEYVADAGRHPAERLRSSIGPAGKRCWWATEPDVGRVADGVPARVDRLRALGNAVVPQIPEAIGRAIRAN